MNEIVILSGKGGTGKTTLVAAMIAYLENTVIADCDVDAPDLHILLKGTQQSKTDFSGLKRPVLNTSNCINCKLCHTYCNFQAITSDIQLIKENCEGCGVCAYICPTESIQMEEAVIGSVYHRETPHGEFVYGKLIPGEETSGKLVSAVRRKAKLVAVEKGAEHIVIDGSPGIACNVIASITGASQVVIVTEPTVSGLHDLMRIHALIERFQLGVMVVVNKCDLSEDGLEQIREYCEEEHLDIALEIPFHKGIVESIASLKLPPNHMPDFYQSLNFKAFLKKLDVL